MATLIYRGASHARTTVATPRIARNLVYRGVSHDGLPHRDARPATSAEMCYRGVRYLLTAGGRMVPAAAHDSGRVPVRGGLAQPV